MTDVDTFIRDDRFISDCARVAEKILTREQIQRRYPHLSAADWDALGTDEMVAAIDLERTRRIRNGTCARERAALLHATKGIDALDRILSNDGTSPRAHIECAKELRAAAATTPENAAAASERFEIRIVLSADEVLTFNKARAVGPDDDTAPDTLPMIAADKPNDEGGHGAT
jgi:hypothetical protein